LLLYLSRHGQHVTLDVRHSSGWKRVGLHELPPGLQLDRLCLENMSLQLYPGSNMRGVLESLAALTQLQLLEFCLLDADGLAGALQQLPQLQHLKVVNMRRKVNSKYHKELFALNSEVLQQLQGLTYLELEGCDLSLPAPLAEPQPQLSNLQSLRLREFRPSDYEGDATSCLLAGMQHLTLLELHPSQEGGLPALLPAGVLTSRLQLQHLDLSNYFVRAIAGSDFLYDLEQLTQLTHLRLNRTLCNVDVPAAAYAALTASSNLQLLHAPWCKMPPGAWQHVLPFGRQLLHLQELQLSGCAEMGVFDAASLVSCCPSLQRLDLPPLHGSPVGVLASLHRLTDLQTLTVPGQCMDDAAVKALTRLTGLQELSMESKGTNGVTAAGLLPLTSLRQLHSLRFTYTWKDPRKAIPDYPSSKWLHTSVSQGTMQCLCRACILVHIVYLCKACAEHLYVLEE
jgi:hypothetical protein